MFLSVILSGKIERILIFYIDVYIETHIKTENPFAVSFIPLVAIIINPKLTLLF
jgi:hypothetical protein